MSEQASTAASPGERIPAWAWDVLVVVLSVTSVLPPYRGPAPLLTAADLPLALALAAAQAGFLLLRRRVPLAAYAGAWGLMVVGAALVGSAIPFVTATSIAAYGLAKRAPRRVALTAVLASVVLIAIVEVVAGSISGFDPRILATPAILAFAGAAGDATRSRRAAVAALAERAERAEATRESEARRRVAEERLRIARDLHDAVAHQIAVINLQSGVAARAIEEGREPDLPAARASLAVSARAARQVLGEIGDLLGGLRTDADDEASASPPEGLDDLDRLVGAFAETGLRVTVRRERAEVPGEVSPSVDRAAYRVLHEALTNAHKHGAGDRAHVLVEHGAATLALTVTNPIDSAPSARERETGAAADDERIEGGHGLLGLRERVAAVRGSIRTGREPGGVFRLRAEFPVGARVARSGDGSAGGGR
ncbi:sensor histidine kinase [Agromyces sp. SYSU T0242]|uniref:sensor histidine kinase n=1 Tax=Agromyces litoreus TaxID=3158561 RepID=UPI003393ABFF